MAFPTGYTKYQEVTIDSTKVSADLTDYVIYVDLSDLAKTGADIFDTCRSDGGDIRVTKSDGTTELAREVVTINTTSETGELHVKFTGTLSSSSDTTIRIWYNGTDTEPAVTATYGRNAVWGDYGAVYHMNASSGDETDSTGNGNTLTDTNTVGSATGQIENGRDFERSNTESMCASDSTSLSPTTALTLQGWFKAESLPADFSDDEFYLIRKAGGGAGNRAYGLSLIDNAAPYKLRFFLYDEDNSYGGKDSDDYTMSTTAFEMIHATWLGSDGGVNFYIDGSQLGSEQTSTVDQLEDSTDDFCISGTTGTNFHPFDGIMDEIRISEQELSANWISTEYNNQDSPSTFYSTSDEKGGGETLTAEVGNFTLTGQDANLLYNRVLTAEQGSFVLTGQDVNLNKGFSLTAEVGIFTLTGQDADLRKGLTLTAEVGIFTLTGQDVDLRAGRTLTAEVGIFTLTLQTPKIIYWQTESKNSSPWTEETKNSSPWTNLD